MSHNFPWREIITVKPHLLHRQNYTRWVILYASNQKLGLRMRLVYSGNALRLNICDLFIIFPWASLLVHVMACWSVPM